MSVHFLKIVFHFPWWACASTPEQQDQQKCEGRCGEIKFTQVAYASSLILRL